MPSELAEIRRQLAEIASKLPKPKRNPDTRPVVVFRATPDEYAVIEAAAVQRGVTRSQLVRDIVLAGLGTVAQPRQSMPAFRNRRKPDHFDDGKSDVRELARVAHTTRLAARSALDAYHAAKEGAPAAAPLGMMTELSIAPTVPKLSR
jgi:hypothetical protein